MHFIYKKLYMKRSDVQITSVYWKMFNNELLSINWLEGAAKTVLSMVDLL